MGCLRLYLAISVVLVHSSPLFGTVLADAAPAVQAFFVISGFYMALVLNEKYRATARGTMTFWGNRVLRLWPTYLLIFGLTLAVEIGRGEQSIFFNALRVLDWPWQVVAWLANVFVVGLDGFLFFDVKPGVARPVFDPMAVAQPGRALNPMAVTVAWTLALEAYFYLLAPWLTRLRLRWVLAVIAGGVAVRLTLAYAAGLRAGPFYYQFFPSELATFLLGVAAYHGYQFIGRDGRRAARIGWLLLPVAMAFPLVWFRLAVPFKSMTFAVFVAACVPAIFVATKAVRWDRWVGELSYPLYLVHGLAIAVLGPWGQDSRIVLPISLAAAALIVLAVEVPIDRIRQRLAKKVV